MATTLPGSQGNKPNPPPLVPATPVVSPAVPDWWDDFGRQSAFLFCVATLFGPQAAADAQAWLNAARAKRTK